MLSNFHPELFSSFPTGWLVSVVFCHIGVVDLECFLDSLGVKVEDTVENDLSALDLLNSIIVEELVLLIESFVFLRLQHFHRALTYINCVVHFEKDRLALLLVGFFPLQVLYQIIQIVTVHKHIESHVVDGFGC